MTLIVAKSRLFVKKPIIQRSSFFARIVGFTVMVLVLGQSTAGAQPDQSEHESHHPGAAVPGSPPSSTTQSSPTPADAVISPDATPMGSPAPEQNPPQNPPSMSGSTTSEVTNTEGMQKMMKDMMSPGKLGGTEGCCGGEGASRKELYPFLMSLPAWTREVRLEVERLSQERIDKGKIYFQTSHDSLSKALQSSDLKATEQALQQSRDSLGLIVSGVAAHRLLIEGAPPQNVALQWFKREMNLESPNMRGDSDLLHGVTPLHLFTMGLLITFALAMVVMYFIKMRRAANLFGRIKPDSGSPPPGASPPLGGTPSPSSPSPPPDGNTGPPSLAPPPDGNAALPVKPPIPAVEIDSKLPLDKKSSAILMEASEITLPLAAKWQGQLRVGSIIRETPNVKTLRLLPSSSHSLIPFTFVPGQFLNLSLLIGGARMNRSYSISSSPSHREYIDLTIRRESRGAVSRHLVDLLKIGELIEAGGPVGRFTFTGAEAQSIVLISGGVGITPMMSIARYLTERSWTGDIFFLHVCKAPQDFIFAKEIAALALVNPKLHVAVKMSNPEGTDWTGPRGRITKEWLMQTVPDLVSRRIHLCGPTLMMDATKAILAELGIPAEQVKTEAFGSPAPTPSAAGTTAKFTAPATGPLVTFSKNNKSAKIHTDQTVLELSEELAIGIEFSCRVGTCGVCKVIMNSGEVEMAVEDGLDAEDKDNSMILACQAKPTSDIEVVA